MDWTEEQPSDRLRDEAKGQFAERRRQVQKATLRHHLDVMALQHDLALALHLLGRNADLHTESEVRALTALRKRYGMER